MIIPKRLKIAGQKWRVRIGDDVDAALGMTGNSGLANCNFNEIHLATGGRGIDAVAETLLHEFAHIVLHNAGLTKTILKNGDDEEAVVEAVGVGMFQILEDNGFFRED